MIREVENKIKRGLLFCVKWRYLIALGFFVLCVIFNIHGSSINEYNKLFANYSEYSSQSVIIGESRPIRSDEWLVHTPYYMSQYYNDFGKTSNMMSLEGQDMIIGYNAPVLDVTVIAKPFTWGYFLLGNERGLSWYWCSKVILMLLVSFELCMIITKKNKMVSLLGALLMAFSPLIQWWFVPHAADVFFWGMAVLVLSYHFFVAPTIWYKNLFTILTPLALITFVIALFPSLQVPVGLIVIALLVAFLLRDKELITFKKKDVWRIVAMGVFALAVIGHTVITSKDAIMGLLNTVYPGKRVSLGDGSKLDSLFTSLTVFTLPFKNITFSNNCEVSTFIHFAPVFMMLYPWICKKMKKDGNMVVGNVMLGCLLVMAAFMLIGFPELLAKITFFSYINRMDLAYGFLATLFTVWGIDMIWKKKIITRKQVLAVLAVYVGLCICFIGEKELTYLEWWQYGVIIIGLAVLMYLMLKSYQKLFISGMALLIVVSSFTINPLARGVGALFDHPLEKKIHEIAKEDKESYWLAINDRILASVGVANGARVLNMVNFYPDFEKWSIIDPDGANEKIYNRYAHMNVSLTDGETELSEGPTADLFEVKLNCEDALKWNVKYLVSAGELASCKKDFEKIYKDIEGEYYIYERVKDE